MVDLKPTQTKMTIEFVTVASKGDAVDFGDLTYSIKEIIRTVSNSTRGL